MPLPPPPNCFRLIALSVFLAAGLRAQDPAPGDALAPAPTPVATPAPAPAETPMPMDTPAPAIAPSWETQKQARTYSLGIPAPRGQITDCNGNPLAQTRVSYNVAMEFPAPNYADGALLSYAHGVIESVQQVVNRPVAVTDAQLLKHYHNRGVIPMDIIQDLSPQDIAAIQRAAPAHVSLHPLYQRFYPNGSLAGHVIGYAGNRAARPTVRSRITSCSGRTPRGARGSRNRSTGSLRAESGR